MFDKSFKVALVAGEASSDLLAASLLSDLYALIPNIDVIAVGGKQVAATPAKIIQDNEVFSVMGLAEVLKDLPKLMQTKNLVVKKIIDFEPDVFIGVDSPDLNFSIAKRLKKNNIPVIHYVSPSVWAWRPKRIYKMQKFIDSLFTLFPFETDIYNKTNINAQFVGHPLAQKIPVEVDKSKAKKKLNIHSNKILALLPGSRKREIKTLVPLFAETIKKLNLGQDWQITCSNVSDEKIQLTQELLNEVGLSVQWVDDTTDLLMAADFALLGSGTVALEAMLCKTPMVVAYRISAITWLVVNTFKMMKLPYYSLPNVLYGDFLVPEVMQKNLSVGNLCQNCNDVLNRADHNLLIDEFKRIHQLLIPENSNQAAIYVHQFLDGLC